jgi:hypothetical protein
VEDYVQNCAWTEDKAINADPNEILCESHGHEGLAAELFVGKSTGVGNFFHRKKMFDEVVGFAISSSPTRMGQTLGYPWRM